jgi:sulfatase maturation enzyme AslB (radical SAM superfamily)
MTESRVELTRGPTMAPRLLDRPPTAPAQLHVLAKPSGPICNLDCEYRFNV